MLIQMDMNTAETLIGCGEKLGLIMVQVAKVLMEIEIGDFIGEVSNYYIIMRRLMGSTNQADSSCFYFKIS